MSVQQSEMASRPPGALAPGWTRVYAELQAVSDGRVRRSLLCGRLEPHLLDGRDVIWLLRAWARSSGHRVACCPGPFTAGSGYDLDR